VSRKGKKIKRVIQPDPIHNSVLVTKFVNKIMLNGKRGVAERILFDALKIAKDKIKKPELEILEQAVRNVGPDLELKSRRVGGATYQVPVEVTEERKSTLAVQWLITFARDKKGQPMNQKLATEILDACNNTGSAIKKREDTHKMAEANRAFAHFKW
jgi:small subunit ribosomal protein S7